MLVAAKDAKVKRFIYAASSSTYGDSGLPKVEDVIGKPLSLRDNEICKRTVCWYFSKTYGLETIGLRYFNVLVGNKILTEPTAVIPKFVMQLMNHETITINGDGNYSRDFTILRMSFKWMN
jgi:UDP-N-acetylglucosamine 4-epimerase